MSGRMLLSVVAVFTHGVAGRVVNFNSAYHFQDVVRDTPLPQRAPALVAFVNASDSACAERFAALGYNQKGMPERKDLLMGRYDTEGQYTYAWFNFTEDMDLPKRIGVTKCPELVVFEQKWTGREVNTPITRRWDGSGDWRLWARQQLSELPETIPHEDWPQDRIISRDQVETRTHMRISKVPALLPHWSELGYKKLKMPTALFEDLKKFYATHESKRSPEFWDPHSTQLNQFESQMTMVKLDHDGAERDRIANQHVRPILSEWTGVPESEMKLNAVYGIREYYRGSELRTHIDIITTHIISAILNLDQEGLEEDWLLEVINHKGIRENITMVPGDMVLYESTTLPHGRPVAFKGTVFRNVFVHFSPKAWDFEEDFDGIPTSKTGFMGFGKREDDITVEDSGRATLTRAQFQNRSPNDLSLFWSGPDGPVFQSSIKANEELVIDTFSGHTFFWSSGAADASLGAHEIDTSREVYTHYGAAL